jgi:nonsense-mediated mRNA decay protein 3
MELVQTVCCLCGSLTEYNASKMCVNCLRNQIDITEGVQKSAIINFCRGCERYLRPPWVKCTHESPELLQICLKRLKGLNKVKLVDAGFIWTEPHSMRLKVRVTVQKEVLNGVTFEQNLVADIDIQGLQCDDCKKSYTPHTWIAKAQVRQKVSHQRTFLFLEQLILKHNANEKVLTIKQKDHGIDFTFINKSHAARFIDFLHSVVPVQVRTAKQLISHDTSSNIYNYKYTFSAEIIPICKDDLLLLPPKHRGSTGPLVLVYKVSTKIQFIDPFDMRLGETINERYWKHPYKSYASSSQAIEFIVLDIEEERNYGSRAMEVEVGSESTLSTQRPAYSSRAAWRKFKRVEVLLARTSDLGFNEVTFRVYTHLGSILRPGDAVMGYDLTSLVSNAVDTENLPRDIPEIILFRKVFPHTRKHNKRRIWRLKRMDVDKPIKEENEAFMDELEEDPDMRSRINLYRDPEGQALDEVDETLPAVKLEELMDHLSLE